jgi:AAA family ATP:ADP antiporter
LKAERGSDDLPPGPLGAVLLVRREEIGAVLVSAAYFFLLLSAYYVLRPVRETLGIARGKEELRWLFLATVTAMFLLNPLFGWMVSRWPRRRFIPATYLFFAANLAGFYVLLRGGFEADAWAGRVFYVWLSVFNLFVVAVFWAFMADVWSASQARRLFPLIAVGGTIGGFTGARLTKALVEPLGPANLLLVSAALLLAATACAALIGRRSGGRGPIDAGQAGASLPRDGAWGGLLQTARSPYLLGICGYVLAYTVTSTLLYFQQAEIVAGYSEDHIARARAFANIDELTNAAALVLQLLVTGRVMRRCGLGVALAALPIATVAGFAALLAAPTLGMITAVQVVRRSANYGLAKPARDALYTVLSREEKYKAKAFIDTFVYRAGDAAGTGTDALIAIMGAGVGAVAATAMVIGGGWALLAAGLGRAHRARVAERDVDAAAAS